MLSSSKSKIGNVFCPIHLWGFSNGVLCIILSIYLDRVSNKSISMSLIILKIICELCTWIISVIFLSRACYFFTPTSVENIIILFFRRFKINWAGPMILNMDLKKDRVLVSMLENSHFLFSGAHFMFPEKHFPREASAKSIEYCNNGSLLPKLFWTTVRKKCSSENLLKFEAEGWELENFLRSLEQFIRTVKGQTNFWNRILFNLFLEVSKI